MTAPALRPATTTPPQPRKPVTAPACSACGSPSTEPVPTMRLCTSAAGTWFRCEECQNVFSTPHVDAD